MARRLKWTDWGVEAVTVITLTTAVAGAVLLGIVLSAQRRLLTDQTLNNAAFLSDTIVNGLQRHMLRNERTDLSESLRVIGTQPFITELRLFDATGRTNFSTIPEEVGHRATSSDGMCAMCHDAGPVPATLKYRERSRIIDRPVGRVLATVTPIYNRPGCATSCHAHAADQKVLGVLEVGLSLAQVDATTSTLQRTTTAVALLTLFGVCAAAVVFARRHEARRQRRALFDDLERQVKERTAALEKAQESLVRTEKLSSLGRLAASIAHEINNPLAGILTYAKLLIRTLEEGVPDEAARQTLSSKLRLVEREAQRCTHIVRNLLDFARERPLTVTAVDANAAIGEALMLISNQIRLQDIRLEQDLQQVPAIQGDFGHIRQALVNIVINACDAMPRGGTLRVRSCLTSGGDVEITVGDTGVGIPPENLQKVLDPFFTTKEKGTGLGLSVVYGIVERHGGTVAIASTVGAGTTVTIRLPLSGAAAVASTPNSPEVSSCRPILRAS
jgi:two-component system, NtrC family, sensor kinase